MTGSDTMLAVVKLREGAGGVEVRRVPVPTPTAGFARVRVIATGICGTDVHVAHDEYACEPPVVMGHEILGAVDAVGDPRDAEWLGARVACETYYSTCGVCPWCRAGRPNLCVSRRSIGSFEDGGFARYVVLPVGNLHRLPASLSGLDGVLAEPLACVVQCLLDPPLINPGDKVLVTGPGAMGQLAAQVAAAQGGDVTISGLDRDADRLAVAEDDGITGTTERPAPDAFDVVIECSGSGAGAEVCLQSARRGARYIQVGIFGRPVAIPFDLVLYKELTVSSGFASTPTSWKRAMALIEQGRVRLGKLITREVPIDAWNDAFAAAEAGAGIKTVVIPGEVTRS